MLAKVFGWLGKNLWLPALLSRLAMVGEFIPSGWSNLHHLDKMTAYFASLHIPAPAANAAASGATELVAGCSSSSASGRALPPPRSSS